MIAALAASSIHPQDAFTGPLQIGSTPACRWRSSGSTTGAARGDRAHATWRRSAACRGRRRRAAGARERRDRQRLPGGEALARSGDRRGIQALIDHARADRYGGAPRDPDSRARSPRSARPDGTRRRSCWQIRIRDARGWRGRASLIGVTPARA